MPLSHTDVWNAVQNNQQLLNQVQVATIRQAMLVAKSIDATYTADEHTLAAFVLNNPTASVTVFAMAFLSANADSLMPEALGAIPDANVDQAVSDNWAVIAAVRAAK